MHRFCQRSAIFLSLAVVLTSLTACANTKSAQDWEKSLAADPRLKENPVTFGAGATQPADSNPVPPQTTPTIALPSDFPSEIPRYRDAQLAAVTANSTRWQSIYPTNLITDFYINEFKRNNWEIIRQPTLEQQGIIEARRNDLQVTVDIQPATPITSTPNQPQPATTFVIQYSRNAQATAPTTPAPQPNTTTSAAKPGETDFIGPIFPDNVATQPATPPPTTSSPQTYSDINKAPQQLQAYIQDLAALGVLTSPANAKSNSANQLEPNKTITRAEYARWLLAANNAMNANNPAKQIRLATDSGTTAFSDVPRTNPNFPYIQGLAEAGLIPSPLSGDATAVLFRPDAPLTREQLILWKLPLDTRAALPGANIEAVRQTWGFQDTEKIDSRALRAVLADFQNGDRSNIRRVFGFTTLFGPKRPVTRAEAAAALWYFGTESEGISAQEALKLKRPQ